MSDFFGGLNGFRMPDAKINQGGPLPTDVSGPAGINGDPDGKYNATGELLGGVQPYAGPKQGRMGSDRNYQQIPHRRMAFVPMLHLPEPSHLSQATFELSHGVDMGDVAWIADLPSKHLLTVNRAARAPYNSNTFTNIDTFLNIATLNYILAGFQRCGRLPRQQRGAWQPLMDDVRWDELMREVDTADRDKPEHMIDAVIKICSEHMRPFGICAGSEKQGGLHEGSLAPVQAAVTHTTTLTVDGQNRDLVNYWLHTKLDAGDNLVFRLALKETKHYSLNHYYKQTVSKAFDEPLVCWQVVPDTRRGLQKQLYDYCLNLHKQRRRVHHILDPIPPQYEWHWRIAQTFVARASFRSDDAANDDLAFAGISQLLECTFAPVLVSPHRRRARRVTLAVWDQAAANDAGTAAQNEAQTFINNGMHAHRVVIGEGHVQDVDFVDAPPAGAAHNHLFPLTCRRNVSQPGSAAAPKIVVTMSHAGGPTNFEVYPYGGIGSLHATKQEQQQNKLRTLLQRKIRGAASKGSWKQLEGPPAASVKGNIMTNFVNMVRAEHLAMLLTLTKQDKDFPNDKEAVKAYVQTLLPEVTGVRRGHLGAPQREEGQQNLQKTPKGRILGAAAARWLARMGWDGVFGAHTSYIDPATCKVGARERWEDSVTQGNQKKSVLKFLQSNNHSIEMIQEFLLALLQPAKQADITHFHHHSLRPQHAGRLLRTAAPLGLADDLQGEAAGGPLGAALRFDFGDGVGGAAADEMLEVAAPAAAGAAAAAGAPDVVVSAAPAASADAAGAGAPAKRRKQKKSFELATDADSDTRTVVPQ